MGGSDDLLTRSNTSEGGESMKIRGTAKGKDLVEVVDEVIASVDECPECGGNNLGENSCWDCTASDYWE